GRPIRAVTRREIIDFLDDVADRKATHPKTGEPLGGPIMANRILATLSKLFMWAISRDIVPASPVVGIAKPGKERKRDRVLSDDEIRDVWAASSAIAAPYGQFVRALLLSGRRREAVAMMRRSEIDGVAMAWR